MLRKLKDLEHYTVAATDGDIGKTVNFLVDDQRWTVRYLIVQTGGLLSVDSRRVLISPISFRQVDWSAQRFHLSLTMDQVKNSPDIDVDKPVSRQHEMVFDDHYQFPVYWGYESLWGRGGYPGLLRVGGWDRPLADKHADTSGDVHLRSTQQVRGYHIQGSDDTIGHVDDFIVDDETWQVRYLVIDTSNWWVGKKVLIAPHWASRVSWEERKVYIDLSRQAIKDSPQWSPSALVDREFEKRLHAYHDRAAYWSGEHSPKASEPQPPASHPGGVHGLVDRQPGPRNG